MGDNSSVSEPDGDELAPVIQLQLALFGDPVEVEVGAPSSCDADPAELGPTAASVQERYLELHQEMVLFVAGYPTDQQPAVAAGLYYDADHNLRTHFGALHAVR